MRLAFETRKRLIEELLEEWKRDEDTYSGQFIRYQYDDDVDMDGVFSLEQMKRIVEIMEGHGCRGVRG